MYTSYTRGCVSKRVGPSVPYCPSCRVSDVSGSAIPESMRVQNGACMKKTSMAGIPVLVVPTSSASSPTQVGTTPASQTIQQRGTNMRLPASNAYDPSTRFQQYFPTILPYQCPIRTPSNDPPASARPCVTVARFQGSAPGR